MSNPNFPGSGVEQIETGLGAEKFREYLIDIKQSLPNDATLRIVNVEEIGPAEADAWEKFLAIISGFKEETYAAEGDRLASEAYNLAFELKKAGNKQFAECMGNRLAILSALSPKNGFTWKTAEKNLKKQKEILKLE